MAKITKEDALRYHAEGKPGKIEVIPTKPYSTQTDLSLAYSPGVAEPCLEIEKNPLDAYKYTSKGNLVAVISNGTAVLGLGDIGPLAGKPVMEGKGLLFKIFAGIDVFDIEVNEKDPDKFIETVKAIAPTFGGINLEDIKAPECFKIETRLKEELDIPVMHDDQHGTAIISGAGLINALEVAGKKIEDEDRERCRSRFHFLHETIHNVRGKEGKHHHVRQQRGYLHASYGPERIQEILRHRPRHQDIGGSRRRSGRVLGIIGCQRVDAGYGPLHECEPDRVRFGQPESGDLVCRRNGFTR